LSCKKPPPPPPDQNQAPPPRDHLAPGELVEGREKAFALPLPHAATISLKTSTSVHIATPYQPEQLANFVRSRVTKGKVTVGASKTTFDDVVITSEPSRHLSIEIIKSTDPLGPVKSVMTVLDVTPPPPPDPNTTEDERWKKAGLKPNGQPLDPKHMQ